MNKSCFAYVRVSTVKQGDGVSLEAQRDAITHYAKSRNLIITQWFEEKETAAKTGRPVFLALMTALKQRQADGLIIHKIDRSARNFVDWAKVGEMADRGIDIHFATESLDFCSRGGRLAADIQAVIAADYVRNLREEATKGLYGRLKQGLYPFKAPIGYLDNGGGKPKTIDPVRGPLVRQAFELYASGQYSVRSLLVELERRGLRNERGKPIPRGSLETLLKEPFYHGLIRIKRNGETFKGVHQPLIPLSLFEAAQAVREGRYIKKKTKHRYTYRSLFRCGYCDHAMIGERQKGTVYYRCHTKGCITKTVREEVLETEIWQILRTIELSDADARHLEQAIISSIQSRDRNGESLQLANRLSDLRSKLERLTDAVIDRLIDQDTFVRRKEALLLEEAQILEAQSNLKKSGPDQATIRKFLELAKSLGNSYLLASPSEKRKFVEIATSNRTVVGKSPLVEPSNWLRTTRDAIGVLNGPPHRATPRTASRKSPAPVEISDVLLNELVLAIKQQSLCLSVDHSITDHRKLL